MGCRWVRINKTNQLSPDLACLQTSRSLRSLDTPLAAHTAGTSLPIAGYATTVITPISHTHLRNIPRIGPTIRERPKACGEVSRLRGSLSLSTTSGPPEEKPAGKKVLSPEERVRTDHYILMYQVTVDYGGIPKVIYIQSIHSIKFSHPRTRVLW